ncbi:flagellin, partial [Marinitoga sp. 1138]|uniref:flagellin n=1 Tax=Marinitoga sp. 1138 TaxID=1643334 RepID=UPI0020CA8090
GQTITIGFESMKADDIGITTQIKIDSQKDAEFAISAIDAAVYKVSAFRAKLGAVQNRLEHTIKNLGVASENLTAAESRIRDADVAKVMAEYTRQQILLQSGTAMLSQANQLPQQALQLLR